METPGCTINMPKLKMLPSDQIQMNKKRTPPISIKKIKNKKNKKRYTRMIKIILMYTF